MEPVLYNGIRSARVDFKRQEVIANNLANVNTPGFKADLFSAQSMYMSPESGNSAPEAYVSLNKNAVDVGKGPIMTTGRDLDIAIDGNDGWFAIQDKNGKEAYTRAGSLQVDVNGVLTTATGHPVLGDGGPISIPPAQHIDIGVDGTISIVPMDGKPNELAVIDRIKLVSIPAAQLTKNDQGVLVTSNGSKAKVDANIRLINGALEGSNVNPINEMVQMISAGREYDASMEIVKKVESNHQKLAQLLQL